MNKELKENIQEAKRISDRLEDIQKELGYKYFWIGRAGGYKRPEISILEKIDAICEFLGVDIIKKPESIKAVKKE